MLIHKKAIVDPSAQIGEGSTIGPGAIIEADVKIGQKCRIAAYAILRERTILGDGVRIDSFAVIGGDPQSIGFDPAIESCVEIGDRTIIREAVTVSRGSKSGSKTLLGEDCFLMANSHVGHDCRIKEGVILVNNSMIAGHVHIGEKTFISGGVAIHQFCRIGAYCMISGNACVSLDVPHFVTTAERNQACGLNLVGLRRGHFESDVIADLKACYRKVFFGGGNLKKKAREAALASECGSSTSGARFLHFFEMSQRGCIRSKGG